MLSHLLLMRHAKSSWADKNQSDHDRPLNARGEKAAEAIGQVLTARKYAPDTIWSSDAERTRQTAMHLIRAIPGAQQIFYSSDFYHAGVQQVLASCRKQIEPDGRLMLLGHNPGWAELHEYFTGQAMDYPTGACAVLSRISKTDSDWLNPSAWRLIDFIRPRELEA